MGVAREISKMGNDPPVPPSSTAQSAGRFARPAPVRICVFYLVIAVPLTNTLYPFVVIWLTSPVNELM